MKASKKAFRKAATGIIKLSVFLALLITIIYVVLSITSKPKTPATVEKVQEVLVSLGYEPQDITSQFIGQDANLIQCIAVQKDDIRFEFYNFKNEASATNLYTTAYTKIIRKYNSFPRSEGKTAAANYCRYFLEAKGIYSVAMYVGNTGVYAYSDAKNAGKITKIINEIGYKF